jgi:hypothetical protein
MHGEALAGSRSTGDPFRRSHGEERNVRLLAITLDEPSTIARRS